MKKKLLFSITLLVSLTLLLTFSCTVLEPSAPPRGDKRIVLTFDDGPSKVTSIELLDVLKKHDVKVMFCYVGVNAKMHPEIVTRALNEGHQLGQHTISHNAKVLSSYDLLSKEVDEYAEFVKGLPTQKVHEMHYFRPPFGVITSPVKKMVEEKGFKYAYVTTYIHDPAVGKEGSQKLMKRLKEKLVKRGGGAMVLHEMRYIQGDGYEIDKSWLPGAVDEFLTWAKEEGFSFVFYDEL